MQSESGLQFCLITSLGKGNWGFPKGSIEFEETPDDTAVREAWEEAGIVGRLIEPALGEYEFDRLGQRIKVTVWLLEIARILPDWPESQLRQRCLVSASEAKQLLTNDTLKRFIDLAQTRLLPEEQTAPLMSNAT